MAVDDMHVVIYKMLAYVYSCMKKGEEPSISVIAHSGGMFEIPYSYWISIMRELIDGRYLAGLKIFNTFGNDVIVTEIATMAITLKGVAFLQENSMMQKAKEFLKEVKSAIPFM